MEKYRNNIIERVIEDAANNFSRTLDRIYPAYGDNTFNERNVSLQFSHAFLKRPNSYAIMEVPSWNENNKRHDHRIDAYFFDSGIGIFLETKKLNNLPQAKGVCNDLRKMNPGDLNYVVKELHINKPPKNIFALIIDETWVESVCRWWKGEDCKGAAWDTLEFPKKMCYGDRHIKTWKDGDSKYSVSWLYGYRQVKL